ncbi:hypothetical protein [Micromonospora chersina]|uniref:hypothetical protein n=1 Tax=Micromonospora chersina TaxID=47854 RepID=UPI00371A6C16
MKTLDAGKGEPSPVAAANAYLLAVFSGSDDELGLRRCLCSGQEAELMAEAREWRAKVAAANSEIKVESSHWETLDANGTVSATIAFRSTHVDQFTGRVTFIRGSEHEWRFQTTQERGIDGGWKVCRVNAPPLCGAHLRC